MNTKDLISAIQSGQSQAAQKVFETLMADRVTAAIDARTQEVASSFGVNESQSSGAIDALNKQSRGILAKKIKPSTPVPGANESADQQFQTLDSVE